MGRKTDFIMDSLVLCRYCKKNITEELAASYRACHICKKAILFECEQCHRDVVHKDYKSPTITVNVSRKANFSDNSHAQDTVNAIKAARRAVRLPWWNYYE